MMQQRCLQPAHTTHRAQPFQATVQRQIYRPEAFKGSGSGDQAAKAAGKRRVHLSRRDTKLLHEFGRLFRQYQQRSDHLLQEMRDILEDHTGQLLAVRGVQKNHTGQLAAITDTLGELVEQQVRGTISLRRGARYAMQRTAYDLKDLTGMICDDVEPDADSMARTASQPAAGAREGASEAASYSSDGSTGRYLPQMYAPEAVLQGCNPCLCAAGHE